jgi:hypothetical protein
MKKIFFCGVGIFALLLLVRTNNKSKNSAPNAVEKVARSSADKKSLPLIKTPPGAYDYITMTPIVENMCYVSHFSGKARFHRCHQSF